MREIWNRNRPPSRRRSLLSGAGGGAAALRLGVLALLLAGPGATPVAAQPAAEDLLTVRAADPAPASRGGGTSLEVTAEIAAGWHVNANPPSEDFLVPTEVRLELPAGVTAGTPIYPEAESYSFDFSDVPLDVYEGTIRIHLPLSIGAGAAPGMHEIPGTIRYQACNDQLCLAPASRDFRFTLGILEGAGPSVPLVEGDEDPEGPAVSGPGPAGSAAGGEAGPGAGEAIGGGTASGGEAAAGDGRVFTAPTPGAAPQANAVQRLFEEHGLLAFFSIFVMGLALNLTPCVYPMLSVTLALFGAREEKSALKRFPAAAVYVAGIAFMYSVLGLLAAFTGTLFGGFLQNPWVLGGIAVILGAMALSMFGLYELQVPSSVLARLGGRGVTGTAGVFFSGLMVGVFAAPCIGPPIVALLAVVGQSGNPWFGFWSFFVLSLGLGAPYLVLGTYSGVLQKLPSSGTWMVWVKKVFGVLLLAVALFYLSLALAPDLSFWIVPVALALGGLYLGFLERTGNERSGFAWGKRALGTLAIVAAVFVVATAPREGVTWEPYAPGKLELARTEGRAVLLDFYADWCIPCKELDHATFSKPEIVRLTRDFVRLKVDLTHFDSPESEALRERFDVDGVPTLIFLDAEGAEVPGTRVVGFVNAREFARTTQRALDARGTTLPAVAEEG